MLNEEKRVILLSDTQLSGDQGPVPALSPCSVLRESVLQSPICTILFFFFVSCIVFKRVLDFMYQVAYTGFTSIVSVLSSSSVGILEW